MPSAVNRVLSQLSQKGSVVEEMMPKTAPTVRRRGRLPRRTLIELAAPRRPRRSSRAQRRVPMRPHVSGFQPFTRQYQFQWDSLRWVFGAFRGRGIHKLVVGGLSFQNVFEDHRALGLPGGAPESRRSPGVPDSDFSVAS